MAAFFCRGIAPLGLATFLVLACGSGSGSSESAGPSGPGGPGGPTGPEPTGPGPEGADSGTPGTPDCSRKVAAASAGVALYDAFAKDIATLSGTARAARVTRFLDDVAAAGGTPLEDPTSDRVVFVTTGTPPSATFDVRGSFGAWDASRAIPMTQIAESELWIGDGRVARTPGSGFEYKLASGTTYFEDLRARHVKWDGIDRGLGVPGETNAVGHAVDIAKEKGRVVRLGKLHATKLANDREVWAYLPPKYDASCGKLPSIVFHDANDALLRAGFAETAEALYVARPELSAVLFFVGLPSPDVRISEYSFGDGSTGALYVDFLASDLWPALTKSHRLCSKPAARGLSGASLGGLISTFAAFEKPGTWGWVGAQSPSYFWDGNAMIARANATAKLPTRFYLDSGCPDDNCEETDLMAAALTAKGYDFVRVKEEGAEHDWPFWRGRLPGMLKHFRESVTACD